MALVNKEGYIKTGKTADGADIFASDPGVGGWIQGFAAPVTNFVESVTDRPDTSVFQSEIDKVKNTKFDTSSNNSLIADINNMKQADTSYSAKDLGFNVWSELGNDLMQGVGTLASTGNIWAGIGSLATGLIDTGAKWFNYNNEAKTLENNAELGNATQQANAVAAVNTADRANDEVMQLSAAEGGPLMTGNEDLNFINNGGTHEQNPLGGVPQGVAPDGSQNLVEEGEVIYKDYVFSNRLKPSAKLRDKYKIKDNKVTFAEAVKELIKPYEETINDPITKRYVESLMQEFTQAQEEIRMKKQNKQNKVIPANVHAWGDYLKRVPMFANAAGLLQNVFTPEDYTYANKIENAPEKTTLSTPNLLTNRMKYTSRDTYFLTNKALSEAAATRNNILNTTNNSGAARAGLLASDYATQGILADNYLKAAEDEDARKLQADQFNLGVDQFNTQVLNTARRVQAQSDEAYNQRQLQSLVQAAQLRQIKDQAKAASIGTNLNAFADNAYQLYKDSVSDDQFLMSLANSGVTFTPEQRKAFEKRFTNVLFDGEGNMLIKNKLGGKIKRNKRRGLTY